MNTKKSQNTGLLAPRCLTPAETASQLGICKAKVYQMLRENALPHVRVGRRILIPTYPLKDWLNMQAGLTCKQPKVGDNNG